MSLTRLTNLISSTEGRFLYVDPSEFNASDLISNRGNSPTRPFKTIQRALLEVARFSYVAGPDKGNDKYDQYSILLSPGDHWIDNRPGYFVDWDKDTNYWDTDQSISGQPIVPQLTDGSNFNIFDDNNDLFKFNSTEGGVIIPRGTSIIGSDLRKTRIRPRYVPDPMYAEYLDSNNAGYGTSDYKQPGAYVEEASNQTLGRAAFFRVTGACYFWQFSIFDAIPTNTGGIYRYATNDFADTVKFSKYSANYEWNLTQQPLTTTGTTGLGSHHKITGFEYANGMAVSDIVCTQAVNDPTATDIYLNKINSGSQARIFMGDYLLIDNATNSSREVVRVKKVYPEESRIVVYRNQLGTTAPALHEANTKITKLNDLGLYYAKVARGFSNVDIIDPITDAEGEIEARQQENRIVGPLNVDNRIESIAINQIQGSRYRISVTTRGSHGLFKNQIVSLKDLDVTETSQGSGFGGDINGTVFVTSVINANTIQCEKVLSASTIPQTYSFNTTAAATLIADIDTVDSASPYIFNCSIRSVFGICGMLADGSKATGFKSMVVAQYTGVSLQKDDRAFVRYMYQIQNRTDADGNPLKDPAWLTESQVGFTLPSDQVSTTVATLHSEGSALYRDDWRTFHVHITNESLIQAVSVFAVGFCDHFLIEDGGDISITNSNSNFGNTALRAIGFREKAFPQDKFGKITHIIPPKKIDDSAIDELSWYPFDVQKVQSSNVSATRTKLHLFNAKTPDKTPTYLFEDKYVLGGKQDEDLDVEMTLGAITVVKNAALATNVTGAGSFEHVQEKVFTVNPNTDVCTLSGGQTHQWRTGTPVRIESEMGYLPDGIEPNTTYYIISENGGRWTSSGQGWNGPTGTISNRDSQFKLAKTIEEARSGTAIDVRTDNPPKTVTAQGAITATGELRVIQRTSDMRPTPTSFEFITSTNSNEFITVNDATALSPTEIPHGFDKGQPIFFVKSASTDTMPSLSSGPLIQTQFYYAYPTSTSRFKIVATFDDANNDRNLITLGAISAAGTVKVFANSGQWQASPWITRCPLQYDPLNPLGASNPVDTTTGTAGNWIVLTKTANNQVIDAILSEGDFQGDQAPKATQPAKLNRQRDVRTNYDRTYRFRYVLPKEFKSARPPFLGYVIKLRTNPDGYVPETWDGGNPGDYDQFERTYYIYDITEVQDFIPGVQDGVYYLTLLLADIQVDHDRMVRGDGGTIAQNWFKKFKFSQSTAELYPSLDADNPVSNAPVAKSVADHRIQGYVYSDSRTNSITREAAVAFLTDSNYATVAISNITVEREGSARRGREDQSRILPIGYLRSGSSNRTEDVGIEIELRRPSLVRSGNHTFEYVGYGPGNYSTAFPAKQQRELTDREVVVSQAKKEDAGVVFYSGLNSQGDLYVGNQKINAVTGAIEIIDEAILEVSAVPSDNIPVGDEEGASTGDDVFDLVVKGSLTVENSDQDASNRQKGSVRGPTKFLGGVQFNTPKDAGTKTQKVTFYGAGNGFSVRNTGDYRGLHDLFSTNNVSLRAVGTETSGGETTFETYDTDLALRKDTTLWAMTTRPPMHAAGAGDIIENMVSSDGLLVDVTWAHGQSYGDIAHKASAALSADATSNNQSWIFLPDPAGQTDGVWYQTGMTKTGGLYAFEDRDTPTEGRLGINGYYRNSARTSNFYIKAGSTRPNDWLVGIDKSDGSPVMWIDQSRSGASGALTQPSVAYFQDAPRARISELGGGVYSFDVAPGYVAAFGDTVVMSSDLYLEDDMFFRGNSSGISIPNSHVCYSSFQGETDENYFFRVKEPTNTNNVYRNFSLNNGFSQAAGTLFSPEVRDDIMNQALPVGAVIMWSGTNSDIPNGYVLCDGGTYNNRFGTTTVAPNMTDKFVKGTLTANETGGAHSQSRQFISGAHEITRPEIPGHTHGLSSTILNHTHDFSGSVDGALAIANSAGSNVQFGEGYGEVGGITISGTTTQYDAGSQSPFSDLNGNKTLRSGPGTGGDSNGTGYHVLSGLEDPRRTYSGSAGNTLGRSQGDYRALDHFHALQISGTGQSTSGATGQVYDSNSTQATLEWDNQPEWVSLVFIMKV